MKVLLHPIYEISYLTLCVFYVHLETTNSCNRALMLLLYDLIPATCISYTCLFLFQHPVYAYNIDYWNSHMYTHVSSATRICTHPWLLKPTYVRVCFFCNLRMYVPIPSTTCVCMCSGILKPMFVTSATHIYTRLGILKPTYNSWTMLQYVGPSCYYSAA